MSQFFFCDFQIVLIAMCLMASLSLTEAQRGFQGNLSPGQASFSGSLGGPGYQGSYQGSQGGNQGSQSGYQGYRGAQGGYDQGSQGNVYANQRY